MLNRGDRKTGYTSIPRSRSTWFHSETGERGNKPKVEKTKVGTETIDKHPCDKYKVTVTYQDGKVEGRVHLEREGPGGMTIRSMVENKIQDHDGPQEHRAEVVARVGLRDPAGVHRGEELHGAHGAAAGAEQK